MAGQFPPESAQPRRMDDQWAEGMDLVRPFADDEWPGVTDLSAIARERGVGVPSLRTVLRREDRKRADAVSAAPSYLGVHAGEQLLEGGTSAVIGASALATLPVGAILSTSGTTGRSKGVLTTQHYLLQVAQALVDLWNLESGEAVHAPLFHLSAVGTILDTIARWRSGILDSTFSVFATWDVVGRYEASGIALAGG